MLPSGRERGRPCLGRDIRPPGTAAARVLPGTVHSSDCGSNPPSRGHQWSRNGPRQGLGECTGHIAGSDRRRRYDRLSAPPRRCVHSLRRRWPAVFPPGHGSPIRGRAASRRRSRAARRSADAVRSYRAHDSRAARSRSLGRCRHRRTLSGDARRSSAARRGPRAVRHGCVRPGSA